jgi:hypothetical protein
MSQTVPEGQSHQQNYGLLSLLTRCLITVTSRNWRRYCFELEEAVIILRDKSVKDPVQKYVRRVNRAAVINRVVLAILLEMFFERSK